MADYTQPDYVDRRPRYFDGQFLREQDFIDEQRYHLDRTRRLGGLRSAGIVEGLDVVAVPNAARVKVSKGTALDGSGRLLVRADDAEPVDLASLVRTGEPVPVLLAITYAQTEADPAPGGGGSTRWLEVPAIVGFREDDPQPPAESTHPRLARVTVSSGAVVVDATYRPGQSGLDLRGPLRVEGPVALGGSLAAGPDPTDTLHLRGSLRVTGTLAVGTDATPAGQLQVVGPADFDGSTQLHVTNGSASYGRANLVLTGRLQDANDGWSFGTGARSSLVFAVNEAASTGDRVGAVGDERFSLQLEGTTSSLGFLTRDRAAEPALVVAQDGAVQIGTRTAPSALSVRGDVTVLGGLAATFVGRWTATHNLDVPEFPTTVTILADSPNNLVIVHPGSGDFLGPFHVPDGTAGQWVGSYRTFDDRGGLVSRGDLGGAFLVGNVDVGPGRRTPAKTLLLELYFSRAI